MRQITKGAEKRRFFHLEDTFPKSVLNTVIFAEFFQLEKKLLKKNSKNFLQKSAYFAQLQLQAFQITIGGFELLGKKYLPSDWQWSLSEEKRKKEKKKKEKRKKNLGTLHDHPFASASQTFHVLHGQGDTFPAKKSLRPRRKSLKIEKNSLETRS
jgi:hypothetical protein